MDPVITVATFGEFLSKLGVKKLKMLEGNDWAEAILTGLVLWFGKSAKPLAERIELHHQYFLALAVLLFAALLDFIQIVISVVEFLAGLLCWHPMIGPVLRFFRVHTFLEWLSTGAALINLGFAFIVLGKKAALVNLWENVAEIYEDVQGLNLRRRMKKLGIECVPTLSIMCWYYFLFSLPMKIFFGAREEIIEAEKANP